MTEPEINIVAMQHPDTKVTTAWIRQFSGLVVQGDTEEEIKSKLRILLVEHFETTLKAFDAHKFTIFKMTRKT